MTFDIVSNPDQLMLLQEKLFTELDAAATTNIHSLISFRPTIIDADVQWSEDLGLWWYSRTLSNRWWNAFGLGRPDPGETLRIACEINIPSLGLDRNVAGAFATNGEKVELVHRGNKFGGGITGATKRILLGKLRRKIHDRYRR